MQLVEQPLSEYWSWCLMEYTYVTKKFFAILLCLCKGSNLTVLFPLTLKLSDRMVWHCCNWQQRLTGWSQSYKQHRHYALLRHELLLVPLCYIYICSLFNNSVKNSDYRASTNWLMVNTETEKLGRNWFRPNLNVHMQWAD